MTGFERDGYRFVLVDVGQFDMSATVVFADAPAEELRSARSRHAIEDDPIVFRINALFVDTGTHRVVIDPGGLDDPGRLPTALRSEGIDPGTVDTVVVTHGHLDHYYGGVDADGGPAFRRARYVIQRAEWEHWTAPDNPEPSHAENFRRLLLPLRDHFSLLDGDGEIVPGIDAITTPGHSPGHMAVRIGDVAVHTGDALLNSVCVEHPEWVASFELWPQQVVDSRIRLLRLLAEERLLAVIPHLPMPGLGQVLRRDGAWRWVAGLDG